MIVEREKCGRRVLIPVPTYGSPDYAMVGSLMGAQLDLYATGIFPDIHFMPPNCYLDLMRDMAAYHFLHSTDCTHLFFWDTDVAAPASALRRLISHDRDIVIAPYPKKVDEGNKAHNPNVWPVRLVSGEPDARGLLEAEMVATGFLLIKRRVIEALYKAHEAERGYQHRDGDPLVVNIFPTGLLDFAPRATSGNRLWWGEDYAFSILARNAGFKIWLDPGIPLGHAGRQMWHGDFGANADREDEAPATGDVIGLRPADAA